MPCLNSDHKGHFKVFFQGVFEAMIPMQYSM
jgi:hypothetical protein